MEFDNYVKEEKQRIRDKRIKDFKKKINKYTPSSKNLWVTLLCFIILTFIAPLVSFLGDKALDTDNLILRLFIINGGLFATITYMIGMTTMLSDVNNKIERFVKHILITHAITIGVIYILMQYGSYIRTFF